MYLTNKKLRAWLKQFPNESQIIFRNGKLVLILSNGIEWECTNYIMQ